MNSIQDWVTQLTIMQQSVLLCAVRGPDGFAKDHPCKPLLRWYRRCILISAFDGRALTTPYEPGGGSFTGPSYDVNNPGNFITEMEKVVDMFINSRDEYHLHFYMHFIHAAEIIGYKHPLPWIANWWHNLYVRMVEALHLHPETKEEMDARLGDCEESWLGRSDTSETKKYLSERNINKEIKL